jgi:hypothetical protein
MLRRRLMLALALSFLAAVQASAQVPDPTVTSETTRFTIAAAPILSQPRAEFGQNVANGFGGGGALLYRLDRTGWLSLRFDASGLAYGHERKRVPFSETVGQRVLVDVTTTNWIASLGAGPELALPKGPVRPYVNVAFSGLLFRTSSSITGSDEPIAGTTNYKDSTRAFVVGTGVRIPVARTRSRLSLDFGVRYNRGGQASYLREGSIEDRPDGSISITPLNSRTPYLAYLIGVRFHIPYTSRGPCPRFLC